MVVGSVRADNVGVGVSSCVGGGFHPICRMSLQHILCEEESEEEQQIELDGQPPSGVPVMRIA
jgi:hypothetical protein